jgi:hypothetical protein
MPQKGGKMHLIQAKTLPGDRPERPAQPPAPINHIPLNLNNCLESDKSEPQTSLALIQTHSLKI